MELLPSLFTEEVHASQEYKPQAKALTGSLKGHRKKSGGRERERERGYVDPAQTEDQEAALKPHKPLHQADAPD